MYLCHVFYADTNVIDTPTIEKQNTLESGCFVFLILIYLTCLHFFMFLLMSRQINCIVYFFYNDNKLSYFTFV